MKTKIFTRFLAIAFLLLGSLTAKAQSCSALSAWQYVVPISVSNTSSSALGSLGYFQVEVDLPNTIDLYTHGHVNADGSDIRFADGNCNLLPYWIQKGTFRTSNCVIWVKTSSIPANGTQTINMYYGNPNATLTTAPSSVTAGTVTTQVCNSGTATFDFFDDFSSPTTVGTGSTAFTEPNTNNWGITSVSLVSLNVDPSDSVFTMKSLFGGAVNSVYCTKSFNQGVTFDADVTAVSDANSGMSGIGVFNGGGYAGYSLNYSSSSGNGMGVANATGCSPSWSASNITNNSSPGNLKGIWSIAWPAKGTQICSWPGATNPISTSGNASLTSNVSVALGLLCNGNSATSSISFYWVRVRQYVATVPTTTPGPEYSNVVAVSGNLGTICINSSVTIPYTTSGTFSDGSGSAGNPTPANMFYAQLSDAAGNFGSPTNIGSVTTTGATGNGSISATLPSGVYGSNFKIRIVSTNPIYTGPPTASFAIVNYPTANVGSNKGV